MICSVIHNRTFENILDTLEHCEMAEIRLDSCRLSSREIEACFSSDVPLVATCRVAEVMKNEPSLQDESLSATSREIKAAQIAERRLYSFSINSGVYIALADDISCIYPS